MTPWILDLNFAQLTHGRSSARLQLDDARGGLHQVRYGDLSFPGMGILGVDVMGPPQEALVRGADLIAVYEPTPQRATRVEVYWRALEAAQDSPAWMIELQVSVQTQRLDSYPELRCISTFQGAELLRLTGDGDGHFVPVLAGELCRPPADWGLSLVRWPNRPASYAELVYPADFRVDHLSSAGAAMALEHRLFPEFLEKGVILRSRIRAAWCPRDQDDPQAKALWKEFAASPLPLTT